MSHAITTMARRLMLGLGLGAGLALLTAAAAWADTIEPFIGTYAGEAEVNIDGVMMERDLSVAIAETDDGFSVSWMSTTFRADGRIKVSTYEIDFLPTDRAGLYSAAQRRNVFGHAVPLDPMKGDPMVWARIEDDTLSVFSLHVDLNGGYQIQEYHRTLADGGLDLVYRSVRNAEITREVVAFLELD
ncbi:MAG: hypothetical protein OIF47_13145 [Marinibacterium sp.]|nr:hypothetical protein [Marinibacterium sp.]